MSQSTKTTSEQEISMESKADTSDEPPSKMAKLGDSSKQIEKTNSKNITGNTNASSSKDRKGKWKSIDAQFHYGNYDRYYGKRAVSQGDSKIGESGKHNFQDSRLNFFKREWFEGKKVLDIGCNVGIITMDIARRFSPFSIVGLDIDGKLVHRARDNLKKRFGNDQKKSGEKGKDAGRKSNEEGKNVEGKKGEKQKSEKNMDQKLGKEEKAALLKRIRFETGNYVLNDDSLIDCVRPEYDVILALSLTKWIHLNWGDDGMKRFFRRVFLHLNPGGVFIMEPQAWATYKKKRALTPEIAHNYNSINFKPDRFRPFLLSLEIGFESCEVINQIECEGKGFTRPIFLFRKSNGEESHTRQATEPAASSDQTGEIMDDEKSTNSGQTGDPIEPDSTIGATEDNDQISSNAD